MKSFNDNMLEELWGKGDGGVWRHRIDLSEITRDTWQNQYRRLISQDFMIKWTQGLSITSTLQKNCELETSLNQNGASLYPIIKSLCLTAPSLSSYCAFLREKEKL